MVKRRIKTILNTSQNARDFKEAIKNEIREI
jgi:hypothetical protein